MPEKVNVSSGALTISPNQRLIASGCPKVKARIEGRNEIALLDTGAEINVLSAEVVDDLRLPYSEDVSARVVGIDKGEAAPLGRCDDVCISVGSCTVYQSFVILRNPNHRVILGMPYLLATRATTAADLGGECRVSLRAPDTGKIVSFQAARDQNSRQRLAPVSSQETLEVDSQRLKG